MIKTPYRSEYQFLPMLFMRKRKKDDILRVVKFRSKIILVSMFSQKSNTLIIISSDTIIMHVVINTLEKENNNARSHPSGVRVQHLYSGTLLPGLLISSFNSY